jgi:hypothetical protein
VGGRPGTPVPGRQGAGRPARGAQPAGALRRRRGQPLHVPDGDHRRVAAHPQPLRVVGHRPGDPRAAVRGRGDDPAEPLPGRHDRQGGAAADPAAGRLAGGPG